MREASRALCLLVAIPIFLAGCDEKTEGFLRPAGFAADETPPAFENPRPGPGVEVVDADRFTIEVIDAAPGGFRPSGVDPGSIEARVLADDPLPANVDLPAVSVLLVNVPDGPVQIAVAARDFAGNSAVHVFDVVLDRSPPSLEFRVAPPDAVRSDDPALRAVLRVRIEAEPNFDTGTIAVRTPGTDDACGTPDDEEVPDVILADPAREIPGPGTVSVEFFLDNPVPPGGTPRTDDVCWVATASDTAVDLDGTGGVHRTTISESTAVTWEPPPS